MAHYADLYATTKQIHIFDKIKESSASTQNLKAGLHCVVAYEVTMTI